MGKSKSKEEGACIFCLVDQSHMRIIASRWLVRGVQPHSNFTGFARQVVRLMKTTRLHVVSAKTPQLSLRCHRMSQRPIYERRSRLLLSCLHVRPIPSRNWGVRIASADASRYAVKPTSIAQRTLCLLDHDNQPPSAFRFGTMVSPQLLIISDSAMKVDHIARTARSEAYNVVFRRLIQLLNRDSQCRLQLRQRKPGR
jgi:hypothetical protein